MKNLKENLTEDGKHEFNQNQNNLKEQFIKKYSFMGRYVTPKTIALVSFIQTLVINCKMI